MPLATPATSFPPPDADYPGRPAGPLDRSALVWLAGLTLLALIPRAVVAVGLDSICDDAFFYLAVSDAYDRGDSSAALRYLNVNVYPPLISALHSLGADPLAAAKWWGVAAGTLVVPPLFGWLRRMLDQRVAIAASGVYALHTEFIKLSPEPIRDPTFWLFCATGFYFAWRAATERRLWLFAACGTAIALAAHTRTEGWLLALPAVAWPLARRRQAGRSPLALAAGVALCLAVTPAFVVAFNCTVLAGHDRWEWGRLGHLRALAGPAADPAAQEQQAAARVNTPIVGAPPVAPTSSPMATAARQPAATEVRPVAVPAATPASDGTTIRTADEIPLPLPPESSESAAWIYVRDLARTLEPVPLLLMLIGVLSCRRVLVRREHLVLSACCAAVLIAVWFRLVRSGEINGRYFLLCFFPAAGAAGIGLLATLSFLERHWPSYLRRPRPAAAAMAAVLIVGATQAADAALGTHPSRLAERRLGETLARRLGDGASILVVPRACRVGYAAAGHMPAVMLDVVPIETLVDRSRSDVVIIERRDTPRAEFVELYTRLTAYGLRPYDVSSLPEGERFVVLTTRAVGGPRPLGLAQRDGR